MTARNRDDYDVGRRQNPFARITGVLLIFCVISVAAAAEETLICRAGSKAAAISSADTAIAAAKKAWSAVYEKAGWHKVFSPESVAAAEPYSALLKNGIWIVSGKHKPGATSPTAQVCASDGSTSVGASEN